MPSKLASEAFHEKKDTANPRPENGPTKNGIGTIAFGGWMFRGAVLREACLAILKFESII